MTYKKEIAILFALLLILVGAFVRLNAQAPLSQYAQTGNSISRGLIGTQSWMFPNMNPQPLITGHDGKTCNDFLQNGWIDSDIPQPTPVVGLTLGTVEVEQRLPSYQFVYCMVQLVADLTTRNPAVLIIVTNVPPWNTANCWQQYDPRPLITEYNTALAQLPQTFPNVTIVDEHTVFDRGDGWAIPVDINFICGVHIEPPQGGRLTMGAWWWGVELAPAVWGELGRI